jgi:hypothetical protein
MEWLDSSAVRMATATSCSRRLKAHDCHGRVTIQCPRFMTDDQLAEVLEAFVKDVKGAPPRSLHTSRRSRPVTCRQPGRQKSGRSNADALLDVRPRAQSNPPSRGVFRRTKSPPLACLHQCYREHAGHDPAVGRNVNRWRHARWHCAGPPPA